MSNLKKLSATWICGIADQHIRKLNLIKLDATQNYKITTVTHMSNLRILIADGSDCGITDDRIAGLNLTKLCNRLNSKISKKIEI